MKQKNMPYAEAENAFYEAYRISTPCEEGSEWTSIREGSALIDPTRSHLNFELVPHHPALRPEDYHTRHRGRGIAEYHKSVTGRSARMRGEKSQLSKAVGCIITLPRDFIDIDYDLTDAEFMALVRYAESGSSRKPADPNFYTALEKISKYDISEDDILAIKKFFESALRAWQKNAQIRDEDILCAVVHVDETFPHLHILCLPSCTRSDGTPTFSTDRFINRKTHYFDTLHQNIISLMALDGIDASGLLNGATKGKGFSPADFSKKERQEGVTLAQTNRVLSTSIARLETEKEKIEHTTAALKKSVDKLKKEKTGLSAEIKNLQKDLCLQRDQVDQLRKNKLLKVLAPGQKTTITISADVATALKTSKLLSDSLDRREKALEAREKRLTKKEQGLEKELEKRIEERLPGDIRKYRDIISDTEKRAEEVKEQEKLLAEQLEKNRAEEAYNRQVHDHQEEIIRTQVEKKLSKKILKEIEKHFLRFSEKLMNLFSGRHQQALVDALGDVALPKKFIVDGKDYGGQTIHSAMRTAETRDIKEAIHEMGVKYDDIDPEDVIHIRKAMQSGSTLHDAVSEIANGIKKNLMR